MSLQKKKFESAYNRAIQVMLEDKIFEEYESPYDFMYGNYREQYDDELAPTVKEIATGRLLTMLVDLRIMTAKPVLDTVWW